ncbi:hypothetical protein CEXT_356771 [Caerostris extrusa]|uniref:Uncharacterized protein n=1 Tax=Caerostris extrusa TaxID=172846 RepID=A0AAV4Y7P7_CAEEX|nr:hypothetical protein CEXT_356771 [Caerostris extrusa]
MSVAGSVGKNGIAYTSTGSVFSFPSSNLHIRPHIKRAGAAPELMFLQMGLRRIRRHVRHGTGTLSGFQQIPILLSSVYSFLSLAAPKKVKAGETNN